MEILKETPNLKSISNYLIDIAKKATCKRSKCGSIIKIGDATNPLIYYGVSDIIGEGHNSMPCNEISDCFKDNLPPTFKSDKTCCIHAEQRAIIHALRKAPRCLEGSSLFFIRLDENDQPKHSGKPYCSICSKMALDVGIKKFVLWHKEGWTAYDTKEYNDLTFKYE